MYDLLLVNGKVVNEGRISEQDIAIKDERIAQIGGDLASQEAREVLDLKGQYVFPGIIDDQVHFREPGLTHKAEIATESIAAVAGGTTSFMEMPNTKPQALTQELLEEKYQRAAKVSPANYSFFMGASNDNIEEVLKTDPKRVCGLKIFMGASTGNMLVDNEQTLENIFSQSPMLIATHCEDETTVRANLAAAKNQYGEDIPIDQHPIIRSVDACILSSSLAKELAEKHGARLHILHITTADETALFRNDIPLKEKKITAEACVHHLWFTAEDYATLGTQIKCNPAIKAPEHKEGVWKALLDDRIDVIATDHAPHTWAEKQNHYEKAPAGLPLVQHSLQMMLDHYHDGRISLEQIADKMCHKVAELFRIKERGYIREGYYADLAIADLDKPYTVGEDNMLFKCGWSPLAGHTFKSSISYTIVNGHLAFAEGKVNTEKKGKRLSFTGHL